MSKIFLVFIPIMILTGCVLNPYTNSTSGLNKQYFKDRIVINEYSSEIVTSFSTVKGFQEKRSLHKVVLDDNFLRSFFNRNTGTVSYQIYNVIYYAGSGAQNKWKSFNQVHYQAPNGKGLTPTTIIRTNEDCSALSRYGQCLYSEHIVFVVDETLLRMIAASYTDTENFWQYELRSESGQLYNDKLSVAEIAGLLERVDEYVTSEPLVALQKTIERSPVVLYPSRTPEPSITPPPATVGLPLLQ